MLHMLASSSMQDPTVDDIIKIVAVSSAMAIGFFAVVLGIISSTIKHRSSERTRREIAAYIAEGSMTPEEGERILKAGRGLSDKLS